MTEGVKHLPYQIDPGDRFAFYENYWKRVALNLLLEHCRPTGQRVLDYGSGRGEALECFSAAGFSVVGTDIDPQCVELSSRFGEAVLLKPDDPVGQFAARSFDIVTCFHVLEHVENPKQTLTALSKIARKFVLLAVPNLRYLHRLFERKFDLSNINEGHLQSWDHWHLRNLAERHCGLKLVSWASDATALPLISPLCLRIGGPRLAIALETGLFRRMFPFHCISVIGLFEPAAA
jgi:SAM-dependent methyltransferase